MQRNFKVRGHIESTTLDDEDQDFQTTLDNEDQDFQTTLDNEDQDFQTTLDGTASITDDVPDFDPRLLHSPGSFRFVPTVNSIFDTMNYNPKTGEFEMKSLPTIINGFCAVVAMFAERNAYREEADLHAEEAAKGKKEADQMLKLEQELRKVGIERDHEVDDEEIRTARLSMGYVNGCTNIGIVGRQNEGKSMLVNCFCGIPHGSKGSAMIGEAEVTLTPTPYKDEKHPGYVWHDIPGGGTKNFSAWGYYFNQRLFAYDKLVLVHTSTLSELDLKILKIGKYRKQECIVVRTKADDHIRNCKRRNNHATVEEARADFIQQVRQDTEAKNASMSDVHTLCPDYTDYIISEMGLAQLINNTGKSKDPYEQVIDEPELLRRLGLWD
ncbi:hypothetical protein G7Z17_g218 [Cylindrodendrum hubeiense]|uniref:IRG-type G domain-containing protein n=1 Tax=Cylindrodendrum hubeiense TaxID=595255 RepID=A0A9P5HH39_9HYPO|nr:hypothetical protein G7Z17_g218 [Cylindrodendrum hubeiense]